MNTENSNKIEIILEDASEPIIELEPIKVINEDDYYDDDDDDYFDYDSSPSSDYDGYVNETWPSF